MSSTGSEKHCRLCLMLSKGGTKACHHLLLKRVEDLKPRDTKPNEWTLISFLNSKKQIIIESKLSKKKHKILFPKTGDTVLLDWDLSLFCHVLTSCCDLPCLDRLDIENLRKIRNELCHMNDAEITNLEFENKFEMVQVIIGRILEKLDDKDLKLEVDTIIKKLKNESLSLDETLKEMRKFYLMEMDIHEKLDHVEEKVLERLEKLDDKCEMINNKLDQRPSSGIDSATNNYLVPGVDIFLDLKNVNDDEEEKMSDVLQKLFEEVINQDNDLKSSIPPNSYDRLRKAVNKTFQLFLSKGWRIISAKHECIRLHVRCSNFKSLAALFRDHINGQICNHLTYLNEAIAECVSGGKSYFQTIIYKDEFWNVLDESISSVDTFLSNLNIDVAKQNDDVQPLNKGRMATLSLTAQNVRSEYNASFERDCNNELHTCLQLLKSELESEFHAPHLSIQASCSTNVNRETNGTYIVDEEENLGRQGNMTQTIKSGDVKISKLCTEEKEISYRFKDKKEKCDKTAIRERSLEEIDQKKGAHEKGKDHRGGKQETTEQENWYKHTITIISPASTSTDSKKNSTASGRKRSWQGFSHTEGSGTFDQKKELCINLIEEETMSKTNVRHVSDSMLYRNDESWDTCIERRSKSDAKVLLENGILPSKSELNKAYHAFGKTSAIFLNICSTISQHIKKDLKDAIDVLPSYQADSAFVVFLIISENVSSLPVFKDHDIKCAYPFSTEGDIVAQSEIKDGTMDHSDEDIYEHLRKCINKNADDLLKRHSNLNVILPSSKKSVGYRSGQHKILEKPCIALYVTVKGYIPLNEAPFPTNIDGFQTDVLEGEFEPYMEGPNVYHEYLKIGLAIHANVSDGNGTNILGGTLGGFIDHSVHGLCGLTCAHVVYSAAELMKIKDKKQFSSRKKVYQPIGDRSSPFGEVVQAVYDEGSPSTSGIEVALIRIQNRQPTNGSFPETVKDFEAGFDASNPLCFNSGAVYETSKIKRRTEVYKFGMTSGITRGSFDLQGAVLRKGQMQGLCQGFGFKLMNQMVVLQIGENPFAEHGDSGALVLIQGEEDSIAIGIVEGGMKGRVFVTPICDILRTVGCTELKMHRFEPTCTQLSLDSGVEMEIC